MPMKNLAPACMALVMLAGAPLAQARNAKLLLPLAPVMKQNATRALTGNMAVRFGAGTADGLEIVNQQIEAQAKVDPFTGAGAHRHTRPDEEVCRDAFRKALAELVKKARAAGGGTLVDVVSYYDHVEMASADVYECHVGMTKAVVALKAKVAR